MYLKENCELLDDVALEWKTVVFSSLFGRPEAHERECVKQHKHDIHVKCASPH